MAVTVMLSSQARQQIEEWANGQTDKPGRSEAAARLINLGLASDRPVRDGAHKGASRAKAMASEQIERLNDPTATDEEHKKRRRRLLKGPEEFREMRGDLPKKVNKAKKA